MAGTLFKLNLVFVLLILNDQRGPSRTLREAKKCPGSNACRPWVLTFLFLEGGMGTYAPRNSWGMEFVGQSLALPRHSFLRWEEGTTSWSPLWVSHTLSNCALGREGGGGLNIQAPVKPSKKNSVIYSTAKESGNVAQQLSLTKEEQQFGKTLAVLVSAAVFFGSF